MLQILHPKPYATNILFHVRPLSVGERIFLADPGPKKRLKLSLEDRIGNGHIGL